jgi:hypothetical protein
MTQKDNRGESKEKRKGKKKKKRYRRYIGTPRMTLSILLKRF